MKLSSTSLPRVVAAALLLAILFAAPLGAGAAPSTRIGTSAASPGNAAAGGYASPTYGYTLTYDPNVWTEKIATSDTTGDHLELTNGTSIVTFWGFNSTAGAGSCVDAELAALKKDPHVSNLQIGVDAQNNPMRGTTDAGVVWALIWVTYTPDNGNPADFSIFESCRDLFKGTSLIEIRQDVPFDQYNDQIQARTDLLAGLVLTGGGAEIGNGTYANSGNSTSGNATTNGDDAAAFAAYLGQKSKATVIFGPKRGKLVLDQSKSTIATSGLNVENFIAHAEFGNPYAPTASAGFDFGMLIRFGQSPFLRAIVSSFGKWHLMPGGGNAKAIASGPVKGVNTRKGGSNSMDLVVVGRAGYLGVNGAFVAKLDLSSIAGPGDVAVGASFLTDDFQQGAATTYKNFTVWSVTANASLGNAGNGTSSNSGNSASGNATSGNAGNGTSGSYVSPAYGYTLSYDPKVWSQTAATSDKTGDYLELTNGTSFVSLRGFGSAARASSCVDAEIALLKKDKHVSHIRIGTDVYNHELKGTTNQGGVWGVIESTYTTDNGKPSDVSMYVECRDLVKGKSRLDILQAVLLDKYNDEIQARATLLAGLVLTGASGNSPSGGGALIFPLFAAGSPIDLVSVAANAKDAAKTDLKISGPGVPAGAVALVHKGTCAKFAANPDYCLSPFDANGGSATTLKVSLSTLESGGHVVVIHQSLDDLTKAFACGAIAK